MTKFDKPNQYIRTLKKIPSSLRELQETMVKIQKDIALLNEKDRISSKRHANVEHEVRSLDTLKQSIDALSEKLERVDMLYADINHKVLTIGSGSKDRENVQQNKPVSTRLQADNHLLDAFYIEFENKFRGSEDDIKKRQEFYLPYVKDIWAKVKVADKKILDIGCGRGEFVELTAENGYKSIGLDLNDMMVKAVKSKGYEAVKADAVTYLRDSLPNSWSIISGFHLVEHIPFEILMELFEECYRALAPGGAVIFETPNPENVIVGSCNFYFDPSHLHPIPPPVLAFALESRGFKSEIIRLHPAKKDADLNSDDELTLEMAKRFYGPQDYAVIAYK